MPKFVKGNKPLTTRTKIRKNLSQKSSEYEGRQSDGSKTFWFSDSVEVFRTSFYGIVGANGEGFEGFPPNPIATKYARDVLFTMNRYTSKNGTNNLSSLMYLYNYLDKMAEQLARDEKRYLRKKLQDVKNHSKLRGENDSLDYILPGGEKAFENAIGSDNFSEAFTLLMSNADSYEALMAELDEGFREGLYKNGNMSGSASKTSNFYNDIDFNYLLSKTADGQRFLENVYRVFDLQLDEEGNLELKINEKRAGDFDKLSAEIVRLAAKAYDVESDVAAQFEDNKQLTIKALSKKFAERMNGKKKTIPRQWRAELEKLGTPKDDANKVRNSIEKSLKNGTVVKNFSKRNTKVYNDLRKISIKYILNDVFKQAQMGYQHETAVASHASKKGLVYLTGTTETERKSLSKTDTVSRVMTTDLVMLDGPFENMMDSKMKELRKKWLEGTSSSKEAILKETIEYLKKRAIKEGRDVRDIFEVKLNLKGYRSNKKLDVAYEDTFSTVGGRLHHFANDLKRQKSNAIDETIKHREEYAWIHRARSFDNLLWMLNNTFKKGFAEKEIQTVSNMIAGVFFLWMWEDVGENFTTFTEQMAQERGIHTTIYVFNSGSAYFTASQILRQAANYVLGMRDQVNKMVTVEIKPTTEITTEYYKKLREDFPVGSDLAKKDPKAINTPESNREILRKRWNILRNKSIKGGKVSLKIDQYELDKLLGTLSIVNRNK